MKRPLLKRAIKWVAIGVGSFTALLVIALAATIIYLRTDAGAKKLAEIVTSQAKPFVPGLRVGAIRGTYLDEIVIEDIVVKDREGRRAVSAKEVRINYKLMPLLSKKISIQIVKITQPKVNVHQNEDGEINLANLVADQPASETPTQTENSEAQPIDWRIELEKFAIVDGGVDAHLTDTNQMRVQDLEIVASARFDKALSADFSVSLKTPIQGQSTAGRLELKGTIAKDDTLTYKLSLNGKELSPRFVQSTLPKASLTFEANLNGRGIPTTPSSKAELKLLSTNSNVSRIGKLTFDLAGNMEGRRWSLSPSALSLGQNRVNLEANGSLDEAEAKVKLRVPKLASMSTISPAIPPLEGRVELDANIFANRKGKMRVNVKTLMRGIRFEEARVEKADADIALNGSFRQPQGTIELRAEGIALAGTPSIKTLSLSAQGSPKSIAASIKADGTDVAASVVSQIKATQSRIDITLSQTSLRYKKEKAKLVGSMYASLWPNQQRIATKPAHWRIAGGHLRFDGEASGRGEVPFRLRLSAKGFDFDRIRRMLNSFGQNTPEVEGEIALSVAGQGKLFGSFSTDIGIETEKLTLDDKTFGAIDCQLKAQGRKSNIAIEGLVLRNERPVVTVEAKAKSGLQALLKKKPSTIFVDMSSTIAALDLAILRTIDRRLESAAGTLNGSFAMKGKIGRPRFSADLSLRDARIAELDIGSAQTSLSLENNELNASLSLTQKGGGSMQLTSAAHVNSRQPMKSDIRKLNLDVSGLEVGVLSSVIPGAREFKGQLSGHVEASGSVNNPQIDGQLLLENGQLHLRDLPRLRKMTAKLKLKNLEEIVIEDIRALSGDGKLKGDGSLKLVDGNQAQAKLSLKLDDFRLGVAPVPDGTLSGVVSAEAQLSDEKLRAEIELSKGEVTVPAIETKRDLHEENRSLPGVVFIEPQTTQDGKVAVRNGKKSEKQSAQEKVLDMRVVAHADPLFVRGEQMDVETRIDVTATSTSDGNTVLSGDASIRRGRITVLSNAFEVDRAQVTFQKAVPPNPTLDIALKRQFAEATVIVELVGTAKTPKMTLRSEPAIYDQSQIVNLLVTGRVDMRAGGGGGSTASAVASAVSQAVLGTLAREIAPGVGIDVARISVEGKDDGTSAQKTSAEFGKYVTRRMYIGYKRVFGADTDENVNEGIMEYRISQRWFATATLGDAGVGGLDLLWTYRY